MRLRTSGHVSEQATGRMVGQAVQNGWRVERVEGCPSDLLNVPSEAWAGVDCAGVDLYASQKHEEAQLAQLASGLESCQRVELLIHDQHWDPSAHLLRVGTHMKVGHYKALATPAFHAAAAACGPSRLRFLTCNLHLPPSFPTNLAQQLQELCVYIHDACLDHVMTLQPGSLLRLQTLAIKNAAAHSPIDLGAPHAAAITAAAPALGVLIVEMLSVQPSVKEQLHAALPGLHEIRVGITWEAAFNGWGY